jgi:acyl-CoA-dependent ceramide synthase
MPPGSKFAGMNPSSIDSKDSETLEAAHEWLHQNGNNVAGIEQKLSYRDSEEFPARQMIIKRKVKKKQDGPLEIICGWVVENQIGGGKPFSLIESY